MVQEHTITYVTKCPACGCELNQVIDVNDRYVDTICEDCGETFSVDLYWLRVCSSKRLAYRQDRQKAPKEFPIKSKNGQIICNCKQKRNGQIILTTDNAEITFDDFMKQVLGNPVR